MRYLACLLPLLVVTAVAAPRVEQGPDGLSVRTAHYLATFAADSGLLHTLTLADGMSLLTNTRLYCDVLPDGRRNFSARADAPATATVAADGSVVITPAQLGYLLEGIDWRMPQKTWRPTAAG